MRNNEEVMHALENGRIDINEALRQLTNDRATDGNGLAIGTIIAIRRPDPNQLGNYITEIRSAGYRDWDNTKPIESTDTFRIYSATKTLTATVIKQLVKEGKLNLNDTIAEWIQKIAKKNIETDHPERNVAFAKLNIHAKATVEDLLTHTSGIGTYALGAFFSDANSAPGKDWNFYDLLAYNEVVDQTASDNDKNNEHGNFSYSDTGYLLLGLIAEHVTERSYENLVIERCRAEGLTHTCFITQAKAMASDGIVNLAHGYVLNPKSKLPHSSMDYDTSKSTGGLLSTAEDMLIWAKQFYSQNEGIVSNTKPIIGKTPSRCGEARYGYGVMVQDNGFGQKLYGHGGYARGGRSKVFYYPDSDTSIVTLESFETITPMIAKETAKEDSIDQDIHKTTLLLRDVYTDNSGKFNRTQLLADWQKDKNIVIDKMQERERKEITWVDKINSPHFSNIHIASKR